MTGYGDMHYKNDNLFSIVVNWLRIRNIKRTFIILICISLFLIYWLWPQSGPLTSAIGCKNKLAKVKKLSKIILRSIYDLKLFCSFMT